MLQFDFRKYCLIIVSLVFISFYLHAQNGAWKLIDSLPTPRVAMMNACTVDGKIYFIGGTNNASTLDLANNEVYDPLTGTWEIKQPIPTPRSFLATAVVDDTIYAIGGSWTPIRKTVEAYNIRTNSWTIKRDMPDSRTEVQAAVVNGIIYVIGGAGKRSCFAYNPATNDWIEKTERPKVGGPISLITYDSLVYTFGGTESPTGPVYSIVYAYDPQTDIWITKKDMPTPRFAFQTLLCNGKIYAMGGTQGGTPGNGTSLSTLEVYDPVTDTWETKPNMPFSGAYLSGAVVNDKIYITEGTPDWAKAGKYIWEYDPSFYTDIAAGNVSGTWTLANSPYHINGEITIPNDSTLTIEPGVEVVFMGNYKFNVQGRLLAIGTKKDSIRFTVEDKNTGWHGIRFFNTKSTNDTSKIVYCSFKYGNANTGSGFDRCGGAMLIKDFDKVYVSNCLFDSNKQTGDGLDPPEAIGGVYVYHASPIITNSTFSNNYSASKSSAVGCVNCPNAIVSNNIFVNNRGAYAAVAFVSNSKGIISGNIISNNVSTVIAGGILIDCAIVSGITSPLIENNIIIHNQAPLGGGVACYINANPVLINNTIAYNNGSSGDGIYCHNSNPILINNILYGNSDASSGKQVFIDDNGSDPIFKYCDIQGGKEGFAGAGSGTNYTGLYENNIDVDPLFKNTSLANYSLSDSSQCIGAGIDSIEINGTKYYPPSLCINGNPRPSPAGSMPDIGACENALGTPTVIEQNFITPKEFALYQNYPNPFNSSTKIKYSIPSMGTSFMKFVQLKVFDILGNEVATLVNEVKPAGIYEVTWNAANLPSGVYFYQLKTGDYTATRKLLLLK